MVRQFDKDQLHVGFLHASPIIYEGTTAGGGFRAPDQLNFLKEQTMIKSSLKRQHLAFNF